MQHIVEKYQESRNTRLQCQMCEAEPRDATVACEQCEVSKRLPLYPIPHFPFLVHALNTYFSRL